MRLLFTTEVDIVDSSNNPITFLPTKETLQKVDTYLANIGKKMIRDAEIQKRKISLIKQRFMNFMFILIILAYIYF